MDKANKLTEEQKGLRVSWVYSDKTITFPIILRKEDEEPKED